MLHLDTLFGAMQMEQLVQYRSKSGGYAGQGYTFLKVCPASSPSCCHAALGAGMASLSSMCQSHTPVLSG